MVGIQSILNGIGNNPSGFGVGGFMDGKALGNQPESGKNGLMNVVGQSLAQRLGIGLSPLKTPTSALTNGLKNNKLEDPRLEQEEEDKKKDRLETSGQEHDDTANALRAALKNGTTQQIVVSEDGQFEASIDMRLNADGSYTLDMSVHFANSQAAMMNSQSGLQSTDPELEENQEEDPASLAYGSASAAYQRYTSYEQILQTRGFEANIFFEEAKSVAVAAEQAYGSEMGGEYLSVAGEVSHEYNLNISISGDDLSNFNEVASELMQFDDSGTLAGFLDAARGVLTADSSDIGAFVDATQSLVGATQEHVSTRLTDFFSSMNEQFGGQLEELGFEPNFIENLGADVENDLNTFFQVTNNMLSSMFDQGQVEEDEKDVETRQIEALDEQLEAMREKRREITGEPLPPKPEYESLFQNELPPRPEKGVLETLA